MTWRTICPEKGRRGERDKAPADEVLSERARVATNCTASARESTGMREEGGFTHDGDEAAALDQRRDDERAVSLRSAVASRLERGHALEDGVERRAGEPMTPVRGEPFRDQDDADDQREQRDGALPSRVPARHAGPGEDAEPGRSGGSSGDGDGRPDCEDEHGEGEDGGDEGPEAVSRPARSEGVPDQDGKMDLGRQRRAAATRGMRRDAGGMGRVPT